MDNSVLSNKEDVVSEKLKNDCNIEEVDARLIRRCINNSELAYTDIVLRTVGSDGLILLIAYSLSLEEDGKKCICVNGGCIISNKRDNW